MEYTLLTKEHAHSAALCEAACLREAWSESAIAGMADAENGAYCICLDGDTVCGIAAAVFGGDEANITNVAVLDRFRRRGIARKLMHLLLDTSRDRGCTAAFLEVADGNDAAVSLYQGMGFKTVGTRRKFYGDADAKIMRLEL